MSKTHPFLRLTLYVAELLAVFSSIVLFVVFALTASMLPTPFESQIPFFTNDFLGSWGLHHILFLIFIVTMALDAVFLLLSRMRAWYRYPVPITTTNVELQYLMQKVVLNISITGCNLISFAVMALTYSLRIQPYKAAFLYDILGMAVFLIITWSIYYLIAKSWT